MLLFLPTTSLESSFEFPSTPTTAATFPFSVSECSEILVLSQKYAEAALFAHTYAPQTLQPYFDKWKSQVAIVNDKFAASLASPFEFPHMFENFHKALEQCTTQSNELNSAVVHPMDCLDINKGYSTDEMVSADEGISPNSSLSQNPVGDSEQFAS